MRENRVVSGHLNPMNFIFYIFYFFFHGLHQGRVIFGIVKCCTESKKMREKKPPLPN